MTAPTIGIHWNVERTGAAALAALPSDEQLTRALRMALAHGGQPDRGVDVIIVGEAELTELHGRFLDDATPTDVITFDLGREPGEPEDSVDAEIYVSLDRAALVAGERGATVARELTLYVVHGGLHLCGFDDHEDADRAAMRQAEAVVMARLGFGADPLPHDRG